MPRFFFDIHDGKDFIDDEGTDCDDVAGARREALRSAGAMLSEKNEFWSSEPWKMEVRDDEGAVIATLTFSTT